MVERAAAFLLGTSTRRQTGRMNATVLELIATELLVSFVSPLWKLHKSLVRTEPNPAHQPMNECPSSKQNLAWWHRPWFSLLAVLSSCLRCLTSFSRNWMYILLLQWWRVFCQFQPNAPNKIHLWLPDQHNWLTVWNKCVLLWKVLVKEAKTREKNTRKKPSWPRKKTLRFSVATGPSCVNERSQFLPLRWNKSYFCSWEFNCMVSWWLKRTKHFAQI